MKKFIVVTLSALVLTVMPFATASAQNYNRWNPTNVYGVVTESGKDVKNTKVIISCNGHTHFAWTNWRGQYSTQFSARQCGTGSTVTVTAKHHSDSGEASGKVVMCNNLRLNVKLISVSVPEMGTLTGIGAAIMGGAVFFLIRRRNLRGEQR